MNAHIAHGGGNSPLTRTLSEDIHETIRPAFAVTALLQGASALLVDAEQIPDPDGDVWAAREIIVAAMAMVEKIYMGADERNLKARAEALEERAAPSQDRRSEE